MCLAGCRWCQFVCEETVLDKDDEEEGEDDSVVCVSAAACPLRLHVAPLSALHKHTDEWEVETLGQQGERVR